MRVRVLSESWAQTLCLFLPTGTPTSECGWEHKEEVELEAEVQPGLGAGVPLLAKPRVGVGRSAPGSLRLSYVLSLVMVLRNPPGPNGSVLSIDL